MNEELMNEVVELVNNGHSKAIIAFGAAMYRDGLIEGALFVAAGVGIGATAVTFYKKLRNKK